MMKPAQLLSALLLLPLAASAQEEQGPRVVVVPFAALSGDIPQRAGQKAAGMFSSELKNADGLALVDVRRQAPPDPFADALEAARAGVEEARALRQKRRFNAAEETLGKALESYRKGAAGLADVGELQDAYVLLSAIQYNTGRDEDGARSLETALALAPTRELPLAKTSPLFTRVVNAARAQLEKAPRGTLLVESTPPGAAVLVDGVALGTSPLLVKDVPPGVHTWRVQLPSGEAIGGVAQVAAGKQTRVLGEATGQDPESRILAALSQNKVDQAVVEAARQHAKAVEADLLIFGGLSREGKNLALDSFVLKVDSGELKRLPRSIFDSELLSAGMEFYNLVGRLAAEGLKVGTDARLPAQVSGDVRGGGVKVAEVAYGVQPSQAEGALEVEPVVGAPNEPRKPLEPAKKRAPLRK
jgi:hypothetical protein